MRLTIDTGMALCVHVSFGMTYLGHDASVGLRKFPKEVVVMACVGREVSFVGGVYVCVVVF